MLKKEKEHKVTMTESSPLKLRSIILIAAVSLIIASIAIVSLTNTARAQSPSENKTVGDSSDGYNDSSHDGKQCPSKDKKSATNTSSA